MPKLVLEPLMAQTNRAGSVMTLTGMSYKEKQTVPYSNVNDFVDIDNVLAPSTDCEFQRRTGILKVDLF